jgi:hypothetical protein
MAFLVGEQEYPFFRLGALNFVVFNDKLLFQDFDGVQFLGCLCFSKHHLSEISFTKNSKEIEVIEPNSLLTRLRRLLLRRLNGRLSHYLLLLHCLLLKWLLLRLQRHSIGNIRFLNGRLRWLRGWKLGVCSRIVWNMCRWLRLAAIFFKRKELVPALKDRQYFRQKNLRGGCP